MEKRQLLEQDLLLMAADTDGLSRNCLDWTGHTSLPGRKALFCHMKDEKRQTVHEPNRITIVTHKPGVWIWVVLPQFYTRQFFIDPSARKLPVQ